MKTRNRVIFFFILLILMYGGILNISSSDSGLSWGPLKALIRLETKTSLYIGQEADLEATISISSRSNMEWDSIDIALIWQGQGMEIIGSDIIYLNVDPPETVVLPIRVHVTNSKADGGFNVYLFATPQVYQSLTPVHPMIKMAENGVDRLGKGWMYIDQGGDNWKTLEGEADNRLYTGEERGRIRDERRKMYEMKLMAVVAGSYSPDFVAIETIRSCFENIRGDMDSSLSKINQNYRLQMAVVTEEIAQRSGTSTSQAANFICATIRNGWRSHWRKNNNSDVNEFVRKRLSQ